MCAPPPVSGEEFSLDTSSFDSVIEYSKKLADKMSELKYDMDKMKDALMSSWVGKGRNQFEKKYRLLGQQFGDLSDDMYQIYEDLMSIEESYIQADTNESKMLDGKDSRY